MGAEYLSAPEFDPLTVQAVVSHYTDYSIPDHDTIQYRGEIRTGSWRKEWKTGEGPIP